MHPVGMYLSITDSQREHAWADGPERRPRFRSVDAEPITTPVAVSERTSGLGRLIAIVRQRVMRLAGA